MMDYTVSDWFWRLSNSGEIYSSRHRGFVDEADVSVVSFINAGGQPTQIANMQELREVLSQQYPQGLPVNLADYTAAQRWRLEVGGIIVNEMSVDTRRESQALIHGAVTMATADPDFSFKFKTPSGFVDLEAETIRSIGARIAEHVQACFAWEADILTLIDDGIVTSEADIDTLAETFSTTI